jgi:hypothetical protein
VDVKLILSGRHQLGAAGHVPEFPSDFANQYIARQLPGFAEPEARAFLQARLAKRQHLLIPAMIAKSEGAPFHLALFAEWAADESKLDKETLLQSEQITTVMLIERIVKRISYQPLRWIIRYGSVPRLLTREFLQDVMQQPLVDALSGKSRQEGMDDPDSKLEQDVWNEEKGFVFDAATLWKDHVLRYASLKGWLEPAGDAVRFRPDIQNPMRQLLRRQRVFAQLHRAAVRWFKKKSRAGEHWWNARIEWFYHRLQLRGLEREKSADLIDDVRDFFDAPAIANSATLRHEIAATLLTADFTDWERREKAYIEYRLAEAIAAENGYHYLTAPNATRAIRKAFETAGNEAATALPRFAHLWIKAAGGEVSSLKSEMQHLDAEDASHLALLIAEASRTPSPDTVEALKMALGKPGRRVRGWLLEKLAQHLSESSPDEAIDDYKRAARDFEARGDSAKWAESVAAAARVEVSLGRLASAEKTLPRDGASLSALPVVSQRARLKLAKRQPGSALDILQAYTPAAADTAARLEISMIRAEALSQRMHWAEAQQEWERAVLATSSLSDQAALASCVEGMVKLYAWWLRRTDRTALSTLTERSSSFTATLPPAELELWRIVLGDEEAQRQANSQLKERGPREQVRLLLALGSFPMPERRWSELLEAAERLPQSGRFTALAEPALMGEPPAQLRAATRERIARCFEHKPEDPLDAAWYAIRYGELLAWLGFHDRAAKLLESCVPVLEPGAPDQLRRVAVYRERRRVEQRIRNWGGHVDPAPDPVEAWTSIWSHTPLRRASALVENAQRAFDAGRYNLAMECLEHAGPVLKQTPFETVFHRTEASLRREIAGQAKAGPPPVPRPGDTPAPEMLSMEVASGGLSVSVQSEWAVKRVNSDTEVEDLLWRSRGIPKRLVKFEPAELAKQLEEIARRSVGSSSYSHGPLALVVRQRMLSAVPWEMGFFHEYELYRVSRDVEEYGPNMVEPPLPHTSRPVMVFQVTPQVKESPSADAYFKLASRWEAGSLLEPILRSEQATSVLYIAAAFEELTTVNEAMIAGLRATASTLTNTLEQFSPRSQPAVILDVPQAVTNADMIHQLLLRNYFAAALLDGAMVSCILATGLRDPDVTRALHERLSNAMESPGIAQLDLLREIASIRNAPFQTDALFTPNPWNPLAPGSDKMPELLERRRKELLAQFDALPDELNRWKELTEPGAAFEKHHSQIEALSRQMIELNDKVKADWKASKLKPFDAVRVAQAQCAAVHSVWNYFREKLVLRLDDRFGTYLRAADAYTWSCYEPLMKDRLEKKEKRTYREPPLVAFNSDVSPWALSRQSRYDVEPDDTGANRAEVFRRVYEALPIPVIGIPWQSEGFLPGMAALAHETGHVVDFDFGMKDAVAASVKAALGQSALAVAWSDHWWKEVFADLFACWTAGPSFVWALADVVPESPDMVAIKKRPSGESPQTWGRYPPGTLRILLNLAALEWLGFADDAARIRAYWIADYPKHAMGDFESDVKKVAEAVYKAARLPDDLRYKKLVDNGQEWTAGKHAFEDDEDIPKDATFDPRALAGAASKASRESDDAELLARGCQRLVKFMSCRPPGQLDEQQQNAAPQVLKTQELFDLLIKDVDAEE